MAAAIAASETEEAAPQAEANREASPVPSPKREKQPAPPSPQKEKASTKKEKDAKAAANAAAAQEAMNTAAVRVQAASRGVLGRRNSAAAKAEKEEQVNAATKVQAMMRGNSSRKNQAGMSGAPAKTTTFAEDIGDYLTKAAEWWRTDVAKPTISKVRGLPCLAVRGSQDPPPTVPSSKSE